METAKRSKAEILQALRNLQKQKEAFEERADRKIRTDDARRNISYIIGTVLLIYL